MAVRQEKAASGASRSIANSIGSAAKTIKKSAVGSSVAKTVKPKISVKSKSTSSSSSRSSGGSSGGGGGGGVSRSSNPAPRVAPRPAPQPPSINSYLGTDSIYQGALSGGKRSLADYISELGRRRGEATTQYNQTRSGMEHDRTQQLSDLENEFASRGLIQSGLYGEEQGKFQQQFTDQLNALGQQQTGLLGDLMSQENNYKRENDLALQQAKQEALARRAAKFKIGA